MEGKKKVIGLGILLSVLFLISAAYAWLSVSVTSNTKQVIHAGKLDLVLDDEKSSGIHMENVVPTSDIKGREQEGYQFKLINRGTISSRYALYLDDLSLEAGEERMKDSVVKYSLERDGVELSSGLLPEMGSNPNRILDTGIINGKTTYSYVLKVWMDEQATIENQGTIFYTKIRAEAEQTNIPIKKSEMELTPESKERVPIKEEEDPRKYTYTSSDWNVVKVDEEGNIEVIGPGYAIITKTDQYGEKEEITVHVTVPVTAEFRTNDKINSIGSVENNTCNLTENNQITCQISLPEVEVKEGYEFVGWSTEESSHEGEKENADISLDKKILYPIVKKIGATHQATVVEGVEGVKSIDGGNLTCKAEDTYNNEEIKTECKVTLPTITPEDGYTVIGWSTNPNAEEGIASGGEVEISGATTFYPIVKKDVLLITATFKLNGATSLDGQANDITKSCKVHINSAGEALDECKVEVPVITASTETPIVVGFNEDKDARLAQISPGVRTITINKNTTYYAITRNEDKRYTVTFHKNGAKSLGGDTEDTKKETCTILTTYNGEIQASNCSITSPSIEASDNTPRVIGYSTSIDTHTSSWDQNTVKQISSDADYYAQTANDEEITYTATYQKGSNVTSIGKSSDTCKIEVSYNGIKRGNSCTVTAPTITPKTGYTSVGYSETENDTTGSMNLTLTKDTTFYANASANSYKIEYYSEGEKVGESGAQVGTPITLTTKESLGISKKGYNFKGWDVKAEATDTSYADGGEVSDLSTTEGAVVKLYAVWVDDIAPVCTFSELQDSYTVGDKFNITVTCTDDGSGLVETPSFSEIGTNGLSSHQFSYGGDGTPKVYNHVNILSSSYKFEDGKLIIDYELEANGTGASPAEAEVKWEARKECPVYFRWGQVYDKNNNPNNFTEAPETTIYGKTFTATMSQDGVEGVESLESTTVSCTTGYDERSCKVMLADSISLEDGYRWAGWSTDKTATQGSYQFTLTEDTTFYPVAGPIFVDAYLYDQTKAEDEQGRCITGEEDTCERTNCYKNESGCDDGTIFKYAVKSNDNENHRVGSLTDHVYYFHVMHDDGDKLTLQQRESITLDAWSDDETDISKGPVRAIQTLKSLTDDWEYVNDLEYTYGVTNFLDDNHTGCNRWVTPITCDEYTYIATTKTNAKVRLATVPEVKRAGCVGGSGVNDRCSIWAFNYLNGCTNYENGCTQNGSLKAEAYWLSNAQKGSTTDAFRIYKNGHIITGPKRDVPVGLRPVIELTKETLANWKS